MKFLLTDNFITLKKYIISGLFHLNLIGFFKIFQIYISKKWGFTKWDREEYDDLRANGTLQADGCNVKYLPNHGPLAKWCKVQAELAGL